MATQKDKIEAAIRIAVDRVAQDGRVEELSPTDARIVREAIIEKAEPFIKNLTNAEPLWQSKVLIGNITAIVAALFTLYGMIANGITEAELISPFLAIILANGYSIYGRLSVSKPALSGTTTPEQ